MAKKVKLVFAILISLLIAPAIPAISALSVTIESTEITNNEVFFENVLNGGYSEKIIKITTEGSEPVQIILSSTEPIKSWISIEPISIYATNNSPAEFKVIVRPVNALPGKHVGYIIIETISTGSKITGAISTSNVLKTTIEITNKEIKQVVVKNVTIKNIEEGNLIDILAITKNQGNTEANINMSVNILDKNKKEITSQSNHTLILPSAISSINTKIPNNLKIGQYWANITIFFDGMLLRNEVAPFNVVEKGKMPEQEQAIFIVEPPVPLALDWITIIMGLIILAAVAFVISGSKKK